MRRMPRDGQDRTGAERIVQLGWPAIAPVLPDLVRWLRVAESPVADTFAELLATLGEPAVQAVAWQGLRPENCWARHRILCVVLPRWPRQALEAIAWMLTTVATQPDAYDNDLRAVALLAEHRLVDPRWLAEWIEFKAERLGVRIDLLNRTRQVVQRALGVEPANPAGRPGA